MWKAVLPFFAILALSMSLPKKEGKVLSLFNVVQFENDVCASTSTIAGSGTGSTNRNGTCFTSTECSDKGGTVEGSCASGFGVCCVFFVESGTIEYNSTYARNANFPSPLQENTNIDYQINKMQEDVCYIRLDFETFTILGTGNTLETNGGACTDSFMVTVQTNNPIPTICGQNSGQHIYIDIGRGESDMATMAFAFMGVNTNNRIWEIKVTQIQCTNPSAPPNGCLQYNMGFTGQITTFNFIPATGQNHLASQDYSACIRQETGYCCIRYQVCPGVANPFTLDTSSATAATDTLCTQDYVGLEASNHVCRQSDHNQVRTKYCGAIFSFFNAATIASPVCDCTAPFIVEIRTDAAPDVAAGNALASRGVCLQYEQVLCSASV